MHPESEAKSRKWNSRYTGVFVLTLTLTMILAGIIVLNNLGSSYGKETETRLIPLDSTPDSEAQLTPLDDTHDKLAYVSHDGTLWLYDPKDQTRVSILENVDIFSMSHQGRVAYTSSDGADNTLYIYDPSMPSADPVQITFDADESLFPLSWSPTGRLLAFESRQENERSLFLWDGLMVINIMPQQMLASADRFWLRWSDDDHLAFTIGYSSSIKTEIYLWDGTGSINLSQNPDGYDHAVSWNKAGQLLILSNRNDDWDWELYLWDGSTGTNTMTHIFPDINLSPMDFSPTWMNDTVISVIDYKEAGNEILYWDTESQTIIERVPVGEVGGWIVESAIAEEGQVIISNVLASGLPAFYFDVHDMDGNNLFSKVIRDFLWSPSGYLAYCGIDEERNLVFSMWNGTDSWTIDTDRHVAQWQQGSRKIYC